MSGILEHFSSITKSNINDLLDEAEDTEKMIDQCTCDLTEQLAEVKEATAGVMAEEVRCRRALNEHKEQVEKYENLARKALSVGNEDDARAFLSKKQELETETAELQEDYDAAHKDANKMREMHDKLVDDIQKLNAKKETIKAKAAMAKTQEKVLNITSAGGNAEDAFNRMDVETDSTSDHPKNLYVSQSDFEWLLSYLDEE